MLRVMLLVHVGKRSKSRSQILFKTGFQYLQENTFVRAFF